MYHKTKTARRYQRRNHIARRRYIERHIMGINERFLDKEPLGALNKNKIHCSCPMCACKSTTDNGVRTNSKRNYPIAERKRFESMNAAINEYLCDEAIAAG